MKMMFEYEIEDFEMNIYYYASEYTEALSYYLNERGENRWELVQLIIPTTYLDFPTDQIIHVKLVWKRRVINKITKSKIV